MYSTSVIAVLVRTNTCLYDFERHLYLFRLVSGIDRLCVFFEPQLVQTIDAGESCRPKFFDILSEADCYSSGDVYMRLPVEAFGLIVDQRSVSL